VLNALEDQVFHEFFNVGDTSENYTKRMSVNELLKQIPGGRVKYVHTREDPRNYRVRFEKIKEIIGFKISKRVPEEMKDIFTCLWQGIIKNSDETTY
jgi:phenylalanyl-tRNA synthetase beta subunit